MREINILKMNERTITLIEQAMAAARMRCSNLRLKTKPIQEGDLVVFKEEGSGVQAAIATKQKTGKANMGSIELYHAEVVKEVSR